MKEVARLEAELRSLEPSYLRSILEEKDLKIQQGSDQCGPSGQVARCLSFPGENETVPTHSRDTPVTPRSRTRGANRRKAMVRRSVASTDPSMLVNEIRKLEQRQKDEISRWQTQAEDIKSLEGKLENVQKSIDQLVISFSNSEENSECKAPSKKKKILPFNLSNSPNMQHLIRSPCSPLNPSRRVMDYETENKSPENNNASPTDDTVAGRSKVTSPKSDEKGTRKSSKEGSPAVQHSKRAKRAGKR